jgi:hypothetical protein
MEFTMTSLNGLKELAAALNATTKSCPRPTGYFTSREWALAAGIEYSRARTLIQDLFLAGKIDVMKAPVPAMTGDIRMVPVYKLKKGVKL